MKSGVFWAEEVEHGELLFCFWNLLKDSARRGGALKMRLERQIQFSQIAQGVQILFQVGWGILGGPGDQIEVKLRIREMTEFWIGLQ